MSLYEFLSTHYVLLDKKGFLMSNKKYQLSELISALVAWLKTKQRKSMTTKVRIASKQTGIPQRDMRAAFKKLEELNLGKLVVGRRGHETRFQWMVHPNHFTEIFQ